MRKHHLITLIGAASLLLTSTAMCGAKTGEFCGPVVKLTEGGCIGVKSTQAGGPIYDISSANPKPPVGETIMGTGAIADKITICMQGTPLTDVKWKKVADCPVAK